MQQGAYFLPCISNVSCRVSICSVSICRDVIYTVSICRVSVCTVSIWSSMPGCCNMLLSVALDDIECIWKKAAAKRYAYFLPRKCVSCVLTRVLQLS